MLKFLMAEMEHLMEVDLPHARILSAKYLLDQQIRDLRAWALPMKRKLGLAWYQAALSRLNEMTDKAEGIARASRVRPSEILREAAAGQRPP